MDEFDNKLAECRFRLIAFARRRLPRSEQNWGSDYVQDALVEAQQRTELLRVLTPEQTYAWLLAVLKLKMANAFRARRQAKRHAGREFSMDSVPPEVLADQAACPVEVAVRHEQSDRIKAALQTLTDRQRLVIVLHYYGKWTFEEVGKQLSISRQSVLNLIRRGLSRLEMGGVLTADDLA